MSAIVEHDAVCRFEHVVQFYGDSGELADSAGAYLAEAVLENGVAVVISTPRHWVDIEARLSDAGVDVELATAAGRVAWLDAAATLGLVYHGGKLDPAAFREVIGGVIGRAAAGGAAVRAYGEMVALLWEQGDVLGAIELEELWNALAEEVSFSLMCGYPRSVADDPKHKRAVDRVCCLHSSVRDATVGQPTATRGNSSSPWQVTAELPSDSGAPRAARRLLEEALGRPGYVEKTLWQDARLVLSELVTNAVVHARSPIAVMVRFEESRLRLDVHDYGSRELDEPARPSRGRLGLGLKLVALLATEWGVEPTANGKTVWATFDVRAEELSG